MIRLPSCNPPAPVRPPGAAAFRVITALLPETPPPVALPPELDPDATWTPAWPPLPEPHSRQGRWLPN